MATTRLKVSNHTQVYHRHPAANDAPTADVTTSEALASSLGSSADFQLDSDDNQTWTDESSIAAASGETAMEILSNPKLIWIKHSGYTSSTLATATTNTVTIGIGGAAANGFITLFPGESIMIHGLGTNVDNLNDLDMITSSSDAVYVEVKAMVD
tara:strand:- start:2384 stop:2848 length:465 start_codon:yes stop_codon:yes gene_type:complete